MPDLISIFEKNIGADGTEKAVKVGTVPQGQDGAIIKPGQVSYINGVAYYNTVFAYTDSVDTPNKKTSPPVGYVEKETFDALNVSTVSIPANFAGLEAEMIPPRLMEQLFRIIEVHENEDYVEVTARHVWYDNLKNYTLWEPTKETDYTAAAVCRNVLTNALSPTVSNVASDCTDTKKGQEFDYKNKNLVETFLDPENGICAKFGLNLIRYNWDFYCLKEVGYNRGFVVENGKNLLGVERTESIENLVTRVAPIGKDSSGNIVWLDNNGLKYVDSQYIDEYSCPHVEIYDTGLKIGEGDVTEDNIQDKLLEAGRNRFINDKVDLPEVEMTIEFLALGDTEEYVQYRGLDKVYLYDIITVHDTVRGYDYTAQVVGVEHDILTGMLLSVTIGKLDNWDGTRKIATWQVPEVDGTNIRLLSIQAGAFAPGAINAADLANGSILTIHLASATIDNLTTTALDAAYANIHDLIAGRIIADDIAAGAITTDKLAARAITADKIEASAITAEKIAAGAINASKIDTTDLQAINAVLGTATIADARIQMANISYAQIKELNAESAFFGQAVFQEAVGGKLYVPRLAVGYAQMLGATISDLVIQASNDNYYKLDVDMAGNVTATQMTPTAEEIAQGYTEDGRTIYMGTDILATDLNTQNIYASHGLMDQITANIINVDKLFAREATISKINALDLSSNTYIQSTVGNWQSQSTITQTVNSINSRISSLGYGTIYYSETEPSHENLVQGDTWIQPIEDRDWDDVDEYTWNELDAMTWDQVEGQYRMYSWTGERWKLLFDNLFNTEVVTEITQLAYAISLKANQSTVDTLGNQVESFAATLEVQAAEISAAVSSVNQKAATYIQYDDPRDDHTVSAGDIWTKSVVNGTWDSLDALDWDTLDLYTWDELNGSESFMWNGTEWIPIANDSAMVTIRAEINETFEKITIMAQQQTIIGDQVWSNTASITVIAEEIRQEVSRATNAENGKIEKTTQYQTADSIVSEAVRQSASSAQGLYLAKTQQYQTPDSIVTEAVRQSQSAGDSAYLKKTSTYQTADSIVSAAETYTRNQLNSYSTTSQTSEMISTYVGNYVAGQLSNYSTTTQTSQMISSYVATYVSGQLVNYSTTSQTSDLISAYVTNNAYQLQSGISITAAGVDISGSQYVAIASGGVFKVATGDFGIDTGQSGVCVWAGSANSADAYFKVKKNGEVTVTKLLALGEDGTETEVNLRAAGLWKLGYHTVKAYTEDSITLSNGAVVNFNTAASVDFYSQGPWTSGEKTVTITNGKSTIIHMPDPGTESWTITHVSGNNYSARANIGGKVYAALVDATETYNTGWNDAVDNMLVLGTVYRITAHMNDWVKVEAIGTGYTNPGYIN